MNPGDGAFPYHEAFSRNQGWVTAHEQLTLAGKRVAIAGLGGVGGYHLVYLARLGIGAFSLADFDHFELANFNRQAGAFCQTLGHSKLETMRDIALGINPGLDVRAFPDGVQPHTIDAFLDGADVFIDGLDFFALDIRRRIFARCRKRGIPAITAAPIGMGTAYLVFMPGGMSFEDYFRFEGLPPEKQAVHFALGLAPRGLHRRSLMDMACIDFHNQRAPSTIMGCTLSSSVAATAALKLLLGRGKVYAAPWYHQFDAYENKWVRGWLPWGNANPLQKLRLAIGYRQAAALRGRPPAAQTPARGMDAILEQARWTPSGDNCQPWRFQVIDEARLRIWLGDRNHNFFDGPDKRGTLLAGGALLETLRLAASGQQCSMDWQLTGREGGYFCIDVLFSRDDRITPDALLPFVPIRSVNRERYRTARLSAAQKAELAQALGEEIGVAWRESFTERLASARLNALAARIRLTCMKCVADLSRAIDWQRDFSPDKMPARALGLSLPSRIAMRWLARKPAWLLRFNCWGGFALPQIELDLAPGLGCAAHFMLVHKQGAAGPEDFLRHGMAIQRFWLTATKLGLALQPNFATQFLGSYGARPFKQKHKKRQAEQLKNRLAQCWGFAPRQIVFMGRIGTPRSRRNTARSVRQGVASLKN